VNIKKLFNKNIDLMKNSPYIPATNSDQSEMLQTIGVKSFEDLLSDVPKNLLFPELKLQEMLSEPELVDYFNDISKKNFASKKENKFSWRRSL